MKNKIRVLVSGEFSGSNSGFGVYTKNLCQQLYNHPNIEVAEFASYGDTTQDDSHIKWKYYANMPQTDEEKKVYESHSMNAFGAYRFETVLLDFLPDFVLEFRDSPMHYHVNMSGLREYFHWIASPCIDSDPLPDDWLDVFNSIDTILTYSDYGKKILERDCKKAKFGGVAYPGVEPEFHPLDKNNVRAELGIPNDYIIVGTVMRNQRRKLFLDLIDSFKLFLKQTEEQGLTNLNQNSYFYFHTSILDLNPWQLIKYIKNNGLGHRILFTYKCFKCHRFYTDFFKGVKTICRFCQSKEATVPTVGHGLTREELNKVYNVMDAYVQYSIAESSGFPIQEAASSGTYVFATDNTAMSNSIRMINGMSIKSKREFHDMEVGSVRYLPDNEDFVNKLIEFLRLPRQIRIRKGFDCHQLARQHFTWENNANIWISAIENLIEKPKKGWDAPFPNLQPNFNIPEGLSDKNFVYYCIDHILLEPKFKFTYSCLNAIRNIQNGMISDGGKVKKFDRETFFNYCKNRISFKILYEKIRAGLIIPPEPPFLKYSRIKDMLG